MQYSSRVGLLFLFVSVFLFRCSPPDPNKFSDPLLIKIADLQDRRLTDSLLQFLTSKNPIHRKEAALAFASVQDSVASPVLGNFLLEEKESQVRKMLAYALGQTGGFAAVNALIPALEDSDSTVVREVLEALGKAITTTDIPILLRYHAKDSLSEEGLSWALYRLGQRNLSDSLIERRAIDFLHEKYSEPTRLAAAHFFSRTVLTSSGFDDILVRSAHNDKSVNVRMAAANALKKIKKEKALPAIEKILRDESDYRVRLGAVRSLATFPLRETLPLFVKSFTDKNENVAIAASEEVMKVTLSSKSIEAISMAAKNTTNARVKANLYQAIISFDASEKIVVEVKSAYAASGPYHKANLLISLSRAISTSPFIAEELFKTTIPVIKSAAAQALVSINRSKQFDKRNHLALAEVYKKAILDGDPAVIAIIASALSDSTLAYKAIIKDFGFLQQAKNKLALPKDYEALQPLEEAIAYFEGKEKPNPPQNQYNHPIDWQFVKTINKNQKVSIQTNKGEIVLQLLVEEAPGSVANFVDLIQKKYFDTKFVHRVVPNFVIQTGCNRGDGYGSEDYSIRSEFSYRRYKTGSVGMASAGKDTEGTQWFITHSPTPHLDGRYTIFAEAIRGMEVVDKIEVGDKIISASLITD